VRSIELQAICDRLADELKIPHVPVVIESGPNPAGVVWSSTRRPERITIHPGFLSLSTFPPEEREQHAEVVLAHELAEIKLGHSGPPPSQEEACSGSTPVTMLPSIYSAS
jgi:hypothetical protein